MANLVVDIGNTALKAAWADGITLGKTFRYQGERMADFIISLMEKDRPEVLVLSSARKISDGKISEIKARCDVLLVMDSENSGVLACKGLPAYLSPDRLSSIVAARHLFPGKGCTIFDLGTTLTVDMIDEDGRYEGGNISPGCRTRFKSLNRYSKSLPLLDTPDVTEDLGTSLFSSIESGVINGIIFELQGYFGMKPENVFIFTGGDAIYFAKRVKNPIFVVCNLVLMGLAIVADEYVK